MSRATSPADWQPVLWHGEKSLAATSGGWHAVVSLDRGRLIQFSPAGSDTNLLFAPPTREDPAGWGGHKVWLGPQKTWAAVWPPPPAWEHSAAQSHTIVDGTLRLRMPDGGDGWPQVTRTYRWDGSTLICGIELSGGTRAAQVISIMQVPPANVITVAATAEPAAPQGFVLLPSLATSRFTTDFGALPQVTRADSLLHLHYRHLVLKTGHRPQTITGRTDAFTLLVGRHTESGHVAGAPDEGFYTQVYLGGDEPFIELEQLSPLYAPDQPAALTVSLQARAR
jgi:hypothetical protein